MPEPTGQDSAKGVPPFPPGDKDRGVSREDSEEIGYGRPDTQTNAALAKIRDEQEARAEGRPLRNQDAQAEQQIVNERGAQEAWRQTPNGRRFTELNDKRSRGEQLTSEESQELARIIARRENRHK